MEDVASLRILVWRLRAREEEQSENLNIRWRQESFRRRFQRPCVWYWKKLYPKVQAKMLRSRGTGSEVRQQLPRHFHEAQTVIFLRFSVLHQPMIPRYWHFALSMIRRESIMEARSRHRSSGAFLKMYFHILESNGKKQWKSQTVRHVRVDKST